MLALYILGGIVGTICLTVAIVAVARRLAPIKGKEAWLWKLKKAG
ncbi:hypothetical protein ES703_15865 [subsurface metagenome]